MIAELKTNDFNTHYPISKLFSYFSYQNLFNKKNLDMAVKLTRVNARKTMHGEHSYNKTSETPPKK